MRESTATATPPPDRGSAPATAEGGLDAAIPFVLAASACWDTPTPVNAHQIARRLADVGHRVLFVESTGVRSPALAASAQDRRRIQRRLANWWGGPRRVADHLDVLSPLSLPWGWPPPARAMSLRWLGAAVRRGASTAPGGAHPLRVPAHPPVLAEAIPHRLLVYHCVDDYAANPGVDRAWIAALERQLVTRADLVLASSPVLAERLHVRRKDVRSLANVADVSLFSRAVTDSLAAPPELDGIPHPRAVYVGNLAHYRIDVQWLLALTASQPDVELILIGPQGLGDVEVAPAAWRALLERRNVHALGPRPQEALPAYLAHCDVALIPLLDNDHARSSLPLKLFEYLAAGLPVVARDLPNLRDAAAAASPDGLRLAGDAPSFVRAVRERCSIRRNGGSSAWTRPEATTGRPEWRNCSRSWLRRSTQPVAGRAVSADRGYPERSSLRPAGDDCER